MAFGFYRSVKGRMAGIPLGILAGWWGWHVLGRAGRTSNRDGMSSDGQARGQGAW